MLVEKVVESLIIMDICNDFFVKVFEVFGVIKFVKFDVCMDGFGFLYFGGGGLVEDEVNVWNEVFKFG